MRVDPGEVEFAEYLLWISDGTEKMCQEIGDSDKSSVRILSELPLKNWCRKYFLTFRMGMLISAMLLIMPS